MEKEILKITLNLLYRSRSKNKLFKVVFIYELRKNNIKLLENL